MSRIGLLVFLIINVINLPSAFGGGPYNAGWEATSITCSSGKAPKQDHFFFLLDDSASVCYSIMWIVYGDDMKEEYDEHGTLQSIEGKHGEVTGLFKINGIESKYDCPGKKSQCFCIAFAKPNENSPSWTCLNVQNVDEKSSVLSWKVFKNNRDFLIDFLCPVGDRVSMNLRVVANVPRPPPYPPGYVRERPEDCRP